MARSRVIPRKLIQVETGWQVWQGNKLIAFTDNETDTLKVWKKGEWVVAGICYNSNEILPMLDGFR